MSTETTRGSIAEIASKPENWIIDDSTGAHSLSYGDLEIRVTKARLSHGFDWGLYNQGQVVLQGQWCETREEAKTKAVAFAHRWMVDDVRM